MSSAMRLPFTVVRLAVASLLLWLSSCGAASAPPGPPDIVLRSASPPADSAIIEVRGLTAGERRSLAAARWQVDEWQALLTITVDPLGDARPAPPPASIEPLPPVQG